MKTIAAPVAEVRNYRDRSPKVMLMTQHDMLADLVPTVKPDIPAKEQEIRAAEQAEETLLEVELKVAKAAVEKAAADLRALKKKSREAGGRTYYSARDGLDSTPADEQTQHRCRVFLIVAEDELARIMEASEEAYRRWRTAVNLHGQRRTRVLFLEGLRPEDPGRQKEIRQKRLQDLHAFLSEETPAQKQRVV